MKRRRDQEPRLERLVRCPARSRQGPPSAALHLASRRDSRMKSFSKLVVGSALLWAAGSGSASHVNISLDLPWQLDDSACSVQHPILQYPTDIAAFSDVPPDTPCNLTLRPSLLGFF